MIYENECWSSYHFSLPRINTISKTVKDKEENLKHTE